MDTVSLYHQHLGFSTVFLFPHVNRLCVLSRSVVSNSFVTPWTVAHQAPLPMEFSRQGYWSGVLFPSLGDLTDPGVEPVSPALAGAFSTTAPPVTRLATRHHRKQVGNFVSWSWSICVLPARDLTLHPLCSKGCKCFWLGGDLDFKVMKDKTLEQRPSSLGTQIPLVWSGPGIGACLSVYCSVTA